MQAIFDHLIALCLLVNIQHHDDRGLYTNYAHHWEVKNQDFAFDHESESRQKPSHQYNTDNDSDEKH